MSIVFSKITSKSQTVIPREIRDKLGVGPGDRLAYAVSESGISISKATSGQEDDPLAVFSEWASAVDDEAYAKL